MATAAPALARASATAAPYRVLEEWQALYDGNLLIALPDAFGTTAFLRNAPDWLADWRTTLIVGIIVPLSLLFAFMCMRMRGMTANLLSMGLFRLI